MSKFVKFLDRASLVGILVGMTGGVVALIYGSTSIAQHFGALTFISLATGFYAMLCQSAKKGPTHD